MAKASYRVPVGRVPLGGSGGIPPQKFFEIWMLKLKCHLVEPGRILSVKIVLHLHNSIYHHFQ